MHGATMKFNEVHVS